MEKLKIYTKEEIKELEKQYLDPKVPYYVWQRELWWNWLIDSKGCVLQWK